MLDFTSCHITVIGDLMLDQYTRSEALRISPEAPIPVCLVKEETHTPGGAANVAVNLHNLGCRVTLIGLIGNDQAGCILSEKLTHQGIDCHFITLPNHPTTTKTRIVAQNQMLLRLDRETPCSPEIAQQLLPLIETHIPHTDICIFSDYDKGCNYICPTLIHQCKTHQIPILIDPKLSDFSPYTGATFIKPNRKELLHAINQPLSCDILQKIPLIDDYRQQIDCTCMLITLGDQGVLLVDEQGSKKINSQPVDVFDVTGAGDTFAATFTACIALQKSTLESADIANTAARLVVNKNGTTSIDIYALRHAITQTAHNSCILDHTTLPIALQAARQSGKRIVMTNGCFDILHPGHIYYLQRARALGDCLVVAINTDASIRRIKGKDRPIHALQHRMEVLAGLQSVDWIIAFEQDTPAAIIQMVRPDVLVKGADYSPDNIVGADFVRSYQGTVTTMNLIEGCSTSKTIASIMAAQTTITDA